MSEDLRPDLVTALRHSLERLEAGHSLDTVLAACPEHAATLRPLIETSLALRQLPLESPPGDLADRIGAAIVAEAAQASAAGRRAASRESGETAPGGGIWLRLRELFPVGPPPRPTVLRLASSFLAVGLLVAGAAQASASSLPGEPLYPVKRGIERALLAVAPTAQEADLAARFAERRLAEAHALEAAGRSSAPALDALRELAPWSAALSPAAQTALAPGGASGGQAEHHATREAAAILRRGPASPPSATATTTAPLVALLALEDATRAASHQAPSAVVPLPPTLTLQPPRPTATLPPPPTVARGEDPPAPVPTDPPATPIPGPTEVPPTASPTPRAREGWNGVTGVVSSPGGGIEGAEVLFVDVEDRRRAGTAITDADGAYTIRLRAGSYHAVARADGYRPQWFRGQDTAASADVLNLAGDGTLVRGIGFRLRPERPLGPASPPAPRQPSPTATALPEPTPTAAP